MDLQLNVLTPALAALGIGLLIGLEREYSQRQIKGRIRHVEAAGIRTFALVALSGNLLTWLPESLMPWGICLGLAFTGLLAIISYRRTSRGDSGDKGITSEIVLVLTFILGVLTGVGYMLPATILAVIVFCLLHFKKVLHHFSHSLSKMDIRQATQFLIITVVVLPILPNEAFGPYDALNPQRIWLMVVLISAIGFTAYTAIKMLGHRVGLVLTGILGGLVSSTAVTLAMSRLSKANPALTATCLLSTIAACATMFPRVAVLSVLFSPKITMLLIMPVTMVLICAAVTAAWLWRQADGKKSASGNRKKISGNFPKIIGKSGNFPISR